MSMCISLIQENEREKGEKVVGRREEENRIRVNEFLQKKKEIFIFIVSFNDLERHLSQENFKLRKTLFIYPVSHFLFYWFSSPFSECMPL